MRVLQTPIILLILLIGAAPAAAQSPIDGGADADRQITEAHERLDLAENEIVASEQRRHGIPIGALTRRVVSDTRTAGETCARLWQKQVLSLQETQQALDTTLEHDLPMLIGKRDELNRMLHATEARYAQCRLLAVRAKQLLDRLDRLKRERAAEQLLSRSAPLWIAAAGYFDNLAASWPSALPALIQATRSTAYDASIPILIAGGAIALIGFATLGVRRRLLAATPPPDRSMAAQLRTDFAKRLPHIASSLAAAAALALGQYAAPAMLLSLLSLYWLVTPALCAVLCRPRPADHTAACRQTAKTLKLAIAVTLLWTATVIAGVHQPPQSPEAALIGAVFTVLLGLLLAQLIYTAFSLDVLANFALLRWPGVLLAGAGPVVEISGYHHLADYLFIATGGGFGALVAGIVASAGIRRGIAWLTHAADRHADGDPAAAIRADGDQAQTLVWVGLTLNAVVILIVLYLLVRILDPTHTAVIALTDTVVHGFMIGELHIAPFRLLVALLGLAGLFVLARWLRIKLADNWLPVTIRDRGARETVTNLSVYTIFAIGVLVSLTIAGLDFSQLAIIAGALSLGIGFGLQNIVNNFVSGLILLFERPIRPGDWIEVGGTAGYVTKINIRYTLVQTFDRSDVIVPNSQLLSTQVVNWMLQDHYGRVVAPVGVAYGSDTQQVKAILLRLGREHPLVVTQDPRIPPPVVYFMGFGDSSMDFELRAFIRDVNGRLSVRSDLLFSIDAAFRQAGIEIPFPQRDLHIRALPGNGDASNAGHDESVPPAPRA